MSVCVKERECECVRVCVFVRENCVVHVCVCACACVFSVGRCMCIAHLSYIYPACLICTKSPAPSQHHNTPPYHTTIQQNYQVDWEAILSQHPDEFKASVKPWLVPHVEPGTHPLTGENLPRVASLLPTYRARIEALNGPRVPRI